MRLFDRFKKHKSIFEYDEKNDEYVAELNGISFTCEKIEDNYEQLAKSLANHYESKISDIVNFILPDVTKMWGVSDVTVIQKSLGNPQIDLDRSMIVYCEQTLDDIHIIYVEFDGLFTDFYYSTIDG